MCDCVYIMVNRTNPKIIKVGFSNDAFRRVKELNNQLYGSQLGCYDWSIHKRYVSRSGMSASKLETVAHRLLKPYNVKVDAVSDSELFACTAEQAIAIIQTKKGSNRARNEVPLYEHECIGSLRCPVDGDDYYYAAQKRHNLRTQVTETVSNHDWVQAKSLYNSIKKF